MDANGEGLYVHFLKFVFEYDRAKTATKNKMFGCRFDDAQSVQVRTPQRTRCSGTHTMTDKAFGCEHGQFFLG